MPFHQKLQLEFGRKFANNEISRSEHDRLINDSNLQMSRFRNNLIKFENLSHDLDELMYDFLDKVKYITKRLSIALPENKKELISIFCENLEVKDKEVRFDWRKPYFILTKNPTLKTMLHLVDKIRTHFTKDSL